MDLTSTEVGGTVNTAELTNLPSGQPQLHQLRRAASRRGLQPDVRFLVGQRHHQRAARQRRGVPDGRRQQQRRSARRQRRRAGAHAARGHPGVPGRHQPVRCRLRRRHRRRDQRGQQAGHQRHPRQRVRLLHEPGADRQGLLRGAAEPREARGAAQAVGRHRRRSDHAGQDALLRQLRALGSRRGAQPRLSRPAPTRASPRRSRPIRTTPWGASTIS